MFVDSSMRLVAGGVLAGTITAVVFTLGLRSQVAQLPPLELTQFAVPAMILTLAAIAASLIPAFRAASIDPARTLRED
jgi:ABC-type lipoprotein release transport system permease subunit